MPDEDTGTNSGELNPLKVKLPTFWPNSPETWFIQAEAEFSLSKVTQDASKYNLVVRALPQDIAESITDLLKNRPANNLYQTIKDKLIERHSLSIETRIRKLVSDEMIGDRKPSEFYRTMLNLAGDSGTVGVELIKKLWLDRLPHVVKVALIPQKDGDIQAVLKITDQIHEALQGPNLSVLSNGNSFNYQSCNQASSSSSNPLSVESLHLKINSLKKMIEQLQSSNNDRSRSRPKFRSRSPGFPRQRSSSRKAYNPDGRFCWYHFKFGNKSTKCNQPCSFSTTQHNAQSNNSPN